MAEGERNLDGANPSAAGDVREAVVEQRAAQRLAYRIRTVGELARAVGQR